MQQNNNFRILAKERCLLIFSHHYQCNDIIMVDDGDKLEPCPHCNDKPATVIPVTPARVILVKEDPTTPVKAGKQEKQCPDAPKKRATKPRDNIRPIPISPALRFDAPVLDWCNQCQIPRDVKPDHVFCSKCGTGLTQRPRTVVPRDINCRVCKAQYVGEEGDSYCGDCGSDLASPCDRNPVAYLHFRVPATSNMKVAGIIGNLNTQVVLMNGNLVVGIVATRSFANINWDELKWRTRPTVGEAGQAWTEVQVKQISREADGVHIYMK